MTDTQKIQAIAINNPDLAYQLFKQKGLSAEEATREMIEVCCSWGKKNYRNFHTHMFSDQFGVFDYINFRNKMIIKCNFELAEHEFLKIAEKYITK